MFHTYEIKEVRIMIAMFLVLQTISTKNTCQLYYMFVADILFFGREKGDGKFSKKLE